MDAPEELSPLERVGLPHQRPCPSCGSRETVNRLNEEIRRLESLKKRQAQMRLFPDPNPGDGMAVMPMGGSISYDNSIGVTHDVCADCGTCFDFERMDTAEAMRAKVKKLRLETESAVDSLGRLGEG